MFSFDDVIMPRWYDSRLEDIDISVQATVWLNGVQVCMMPMEVGRCFVVVVVPLVFHSLSSFLQITRSCGVKVHKSLDAVILKIIYNTRSVHQIKDLLRYTGQVIIKPHHNRLRQYYAISKVLCVFSKYMICNTTGEISYDHTKEIYWNYWNADNWI